ncbi:MAG: ATP-dependent DNA helicase RecG [Gemmatimonadales bacterium]
MATLTRETPVQFLKGVGPRRAEQFARLGINSIEDLLYHTPHRYLDASTVTPIAKVRVGGEVTVVGRVVSKSIMPTRKRLQIFRAIIRDETGVIECAWPGQAFLDRTIEPGQLLLVTGPVKFYHGRQLVPREQVVLEEAGGREDGKAGGVVLPVYPATEGLSHRVIRKIFQDNLDGMLSTVEDHLPEAIRARGKVLGLTEAFRRLHRPGQDREAGRQRLAFDEMLDLQLVVARARQLAKQPTAGRRFVNHKRLTSALKAALPFELTGDQKQAVREIITDMTDPERMHRLLMGDVGSGKTVVALFAMLLAVENDCQAVIMAPTELLAEQHAATLSSLLAPLGIVPDLLIGRLSAGEKAAVRERIASGASSVIIGTHALIQEGTAFRHLGLVVIDEQHRFGVEQRAALIEKGVTPDVLLLSATPIPRTMALTLYGDLDISTLREKPVGRTPIKTGVRSGKSRAAVWDFVRAECAAGRQAYVVYPVIDESEKTDLKAAALMAEELGKALAPLTVGLVHGRLKADEREQVMRRFRDGEVQVLVATTVIEVGIDVPNATVMIIEHPERFGLAQLHQLRGRVGRGTAASHCVLLTDAWGAKERLKAFAETEDGFAIAELDLAERGMGDLAGVRQSGGIEVKHTDFSTDGEIISTARTIAREMLGRDERLERPEHRGIRARIERRYERGVELFRVG